MLKITSFLFLIACFSTAMISQNIMGPGIWFWVILAGGTFVFASQFVRSLQKIGYLIAAFLCGISVIAILLGLLAATIGGSFRLSNNDALLLVSFFMIFLFGLGLILIAKNQR